MRLIQCAEPSRQVAWETDLHTAIAATLVIAGITSAFGAYANVARLLRTGSAIAVLGLAASTIMPVWFLFGAWWSFMRLQDCMV